jgi:hypothetical protein
VVANGRHRTEVKSGSAAQPFIGTPPPPSTLDVQFQSPRYREEPLIDGHMPSSYTNITRKAQVILGRVSFYKGSMGRVHVMVLNHDVDSVHFAMSRSLAILETDPPSNLSQEQTTKVSPSMPSSH